MKNEGYYMCYSKSIDLNKSNKAHLDSDLTSLIERAKCKEKLSVSDQIKYLMYKGITFRSFETTDSPIVWENPELCDYLMNNSYYYKITAYRKNFSKNESGKYIDLDFDHLKDLAIIDMYVRKLVLSLSLNCEHALKSLFNQLITESDSDGYDIVLEYDNFEKQKYIQKTLKYKPHLTVDEVSKMYISVKNKILNPSKYSLHSYDLYTKRKDHPAIWVLIELMTFGDISNFARFYVNEKKYNYYKVKIANELMFLVKNIRDLAAHNRPIIYDIGIPAKISKTTKDVNSFNQKKEISDYLRDRNTYQPSSKIYYSNRKINDLLALLALMDKYLADEVKRKSIIEINEVLKRCTKYTSHIKYSDELKNVNTIFKNIIDSYNLEC